MSLYQDMMEELWSGRTKMVRETKKLARSTYARQLDATSVAIKYHNTDIIVAHEDGRVVLDVGQWQTFSTKQRLNDLVPGLRLWQEKYIWYFTYQTSYRDGPIYVYQNGMVLNEEDGTVEGAGKRDETKVLKRKVDKYVRRFKKAIQEMEVPTPSHGDCLYCQVEAGMLQTEVGTLSEDGGYKSGIPNDHLYSHMEEDYFVPSLLYAAMKAFGPSRSMEWTLSSYWHHGTKPGDMKGIDWPRIIKSLRRFLYSKLGLAS